MYTNGRGPMLGGHNGQAGGPGMGRHTRMGFVPGMGFRPMRVHRRSLLGLLGLLPLGGILLLPLMMFGGWFVLAAVISVVTLVGTLIGGVFGGIGHLLRGAFSGGGVVIGAVLGLLAFRAFRRRNAQKEEEESTGTVDGEEVETEIVEPTTHTYHQNY